MKKFLFAMIAVFNFFGAYADNCESTKITLSGLNQYPSDDEFLFSTEKAFKSAPENNGTHDISGGFVYECDDETCADGREVFLKAEHVFNGGVVKEAKTYKCVSNLVGNDHWEPVELKKVCGETHISFDGNQDADDDEFLYSTETAFNSIKNRSDGGTVAGGEVYECDNDHCDDEIVKDMPAGHVFEGKPIDYPRQYRCALGANDKWIPLVRNCLLNDTEIARGNWYMDSVGHRVVLKYEECEQFHDLDARLKGKSFNVKCEDTGQLRCYAIDGGDNDSDDNDDNDNGPVSGKTCKELRAGNAEGMACCDLPEGAAKWEGGKCICSGGLKFEIKDGKGMCVQEVKPGEKFECNAVILNALNTWLKDCVENTQIVTLITEIQALCKSEDRTVEKFNALYQTLLTLNPGDCKGGSEQVIYQTNISIDLEVESQNRLARENIIAAHGQLEKIASGFVEASKWKTAEGNFNTARLMTDLSAGVVLGTVGGVVTSVLVKKKQVEEGFEDLKCTIGGQVVGNWGDEFRVGLQ